MTKNDIVNELNKMGYEVREENVVKNGVEFLGISIIDSDRYMIPVFYVEDIIMKAEQSGATVKEIVRDMLKIHNDALRESEELNKPIHFNREDFLKRLYVGVQKESKEDIIKCKTEFEGIEKYLFLRMEALNDAIYSAKISKNILKNVDVDESEAWETAENNVRKETEITFYEAETREAFQFTDQDKIYFILFGILYASRCNNFHGNVAARMNSINADKETFKMYTDIFLLEYTILAMHMNYLGQLSDEVLEKIKKNSDLMFL